MKIYNTLTKKVQDFIPIDDVVKIYCCGPTVYNYAHIGNLKTYINEDILVRSLNYLGYKTHHVLNITDVGHLTNDSDLGQDKLARQAQKINTDVLQIAKKYKKAFFDDMKELNIKMPDIVSDATANIKEIIDFISILNQKGYTYNAGGNVYFDSQKLQNYEHIFDIKSDLSNSRTGFDENKKNQNDFALWFTNSKFQNHILLWDSPFGKGYPGWHIECSSISYKFLGSHFDIHCGGVDHISIHHKNEIAQNQARFSTLMANYWFHCEFLVLKDKKMSKSDGGFINLQSLKDNDFNPLSYRYFCLTSHWRKQLSFSFENLQNAQKGYINLKNMISQLPECDFVFSDKEKSYIKEFKEALEENLNTSKALSVLWSVLKDKATINKLALVKEFDSVLGLCLTENFKDNQKNDIPKNIKEIAKRRFGAKKEKNYSLSDELRDQIASLGYKVVDKKYGYNIEKIE